MAASKNLRPEQRSLRASIAAHAQWAGEKDRTERMRPARLAAEKRFERQVDPATRVGEWTWDFATDPTLLMRFSAATANAHRIHCDWP